MARDVTGPVEIVYRGGMPSVDIGDGVSVERGGTVSVSAEVADELIAGGEFVAAAKTTKKATAEAGKETDQ